jgi:hypothetical protein
VRQAGFYFCEVRVKPGDLVELEDGQRAFFQSKLPDGSAVVLVYLKVPAAQFKKAKQVK